MFPYCSAGPVGELQVPQAAESVALPGRSAARDGPETALTQHAAVGRKRKAPDTDKDCSISMRVHV